MVRVECPLEGCNVAPKAGGHYIKHLRRHGMSSEEIQELLNQNEK